jgi:hypothetical protein
LSAQSMEVDPAQQAWQAEAYNENDCLFLTMLPNEKLIDIFSHCYANDADHVHSLENSITNFMKISMVCKKFNSFLPFKIIGSFCKHYTDKDKNQAFQNMMYKVRFIYHYSDRLPALILVCAGADPNIKNRQGCCLLAMAVIENDTQVIATLLKHHANPNIKWLDDPVFFYVKTVKIAQMFIDKGIDVHTSVTFMGAKWYNVLYHMMGDSYSSDLLELYLKHEVNARILGPNKYSLLHSLARFSMNTTNIDNRMRKARLLINVIPDMVNALNDEGQTPIGVAQESLSILQQYGEVGVYKQFIELCKRKMTELQEIMILLLHDEQYLGDLSLLPHTVRKCILLHMMHYLKK